MKKYSKDNLRAARRRKNKRASERRKFQKIKKNYCEICLLTFPKHILEGHHLKRFCSGGRVHDGMITVCRKCHDEIHGVNVKPKTIKGVKSIYDLPQECIKIISA